MQTFGKIPKTTVSIDAGNDRVRMGCLCPPVLLLVLIQVKNTGALKKSSSLKNA